MVAPVLDKGATTVKLYLPPGTWKHLWSAQEVFVTGLHGVWGCCSGPLGYPPVFYQQTSNAAQQLVEALKANNDLGQEWPERVFTVDLAQPQQAEKQFDDWPESPTDGDNNEETSPPPKAKATSRGCCCRRNSISKVKPI